MQIFLFLLPQLVLFLSVVLVFGIDLVGSKEKKWLPYLALTGAVISLGISIYQYGWMDFEEDISPGRHDRHRFFFSLFPDLCFPGSSPHHTAFHGLYESQIPLSRRILQFHSVGQFFYFAPGSLL